MSNIIAYHNYLLIMKLNKATSPTVFTITSEV